MADRYSLAVMNQITEQAHTQEIDSLNYMCVTMLGGTGGHRYRINALNEICTLIGVASGHTMDIAALNAISAGSYQFEYDAWVAIQQGSVLNQMQSIKSLMAFWSDGSLVGSQLTDLSGNNRHGVVSDNIISDPSAEFGSTLLPWNSATGISNSTEQAHTGTKSHKWTMTGIAAVKGLFFPTYRTIVGEVITYSFWVYRSVGSGNINLSITKGGGGAAVTTTFNPTNGQWVNITGSYTETLSGNQAKIGIYLTSGDITIYVDDISIVITGKAGIGLTMANDAALKAIDTNNIFFTSAGIPNTLRSDIGDPTVNNLKLFCGGAKKYIFVPDIPTVDTRKILYDNFVDHNYLFDSCENVLTVGSGKTYATIQAAIDACTAGTLTNRYRIDIYDSFSITTVAQYAKLNYPSAGYNCLFAIDKAFICLSGVGDITIEGTVPNDATDAQIGNSRLIDVPSGSIRNIKFKKTNGSYLMHHDYASATFAKFVNCEFHLYDMDGIIAYRTANSLALPSTNQGGKTPIGMGMANGEVVQFINCKASGIVPLTDHGGHASGAASYMFLYNCEMTSMPYYSAWCNPTSTLLNSMELTTTPGGTAVDSIAQIMKSTFTVPATISENWTVTTK